MFFTYFLILVSIREWLQSSFYMYVFICLCMYLCISCLIFMKDRRCIFYNDSVYFWTRKMKWEVSPGFSVGDLGVLEKYFPKPCKLIETYYSMYFITLISRIFLHMTQAEEVNWINEEIENKKAKWQNCRSGRGNFCCLNSLVLAHGGIPTSRT